MIKSVGSLLLGLLASGFFLTTPARGAVARQCPSSNSPGADTGSRVRALAGRIVYHDGMRDWFELQLEHPTCGTRSLQLIDSTSPPVIESFRGCRARTTGPIDFAPTGYYSRELYQDVTKVVASDGCKRRHPIDSGQSHLKPKPGVRAYRVNMIVNYRPGDHPIIFAIHEGAKRLNPWQAYASYWLTGSYMLYGFCANGFAVDKVFGTAAARPSHFTERGEPDDWAAFQPEDAAQAGKWDLRLGYTCVRSVKSLTKGSKDP